MSSIAKMKPAVRRNLLHLALLMTIYLASLACAELFIERGHLSGLPAYALAAVPGLCLGGLVFLFARLVVEEQDEFLRQLYIRQGAVATIITFMIAGVWGFLERYMGLHSIEAFWWPTIWCFCMPLGMLYNKITMGTMGTEA